MTDEVAAIPAQSGFAPETAELEPGPIAADTMERIVEHILDSRFPLTERARLFLEDLRDRAGRFPAVRLSERQFKWLAALDQWACVQRDEDQWWAATEMQS
jgi:hypothetical protein